MEELCRAEKGSYPLLECWQVVQGGPAVNSRIEALLDVMWPVLWTVVRTYAPYVTFPVAFVVGAVGYHLEWFIRGKDPQPVEEEKSISERREDRKLDELLGKDHTQVSNNCGKH
eukprot:bmy_08899T0